MILLCLFSSVLLEELAFADFGRRRFPLMILFVGRMGKTIGSISPHGPLLRELPCLFGTSLHEYWIAV